MQNKQQLSEVEMQGKGRMVLMLMVLFFVVPIVVVILMYQFNFKPGGISLGELVNPPRFISVYKELRSSDEKPLPDDFWKKKWSLVYVAGECQQKCLGKLHDLRQLHVSLYKDIARAQRVLITTSQDLSVIKRDYPDLIIINHPAHTVASLVSEFRVKNENPINANRVYLVDSLGYLMMSYPESLPLANMRKDVTRLLRYSWAG